MCIWKGKIDKVVGAKLNDTANANLQRLINNQEDLEAGIVDMVNTNFWDLV